MARSDPQLNFRCPVELKEQIEWAATESGRSLTAEIVQRLEWSLNPAGIDESERGEFVRGVMVGVAEALSMEADPREGIQRIRASASDAELARQVGDLVFRAIKAKRLDLKKLGDRAGKMDADD